ncbi:MAG: SUMF1/EgtB/PvdO family nonheme iron enzyme [Planctomycetes bacterium]|nr:SUMF1/EgtB/PvdO family nonheme iron enzyme [Planctomycetota bacterium]
MSCVPAVPRSAACLLLWLAGCAAAPLGPRPAPAWLEIDNPHGFALRVEAVVGDGCEPLCELGTERSVRLGVVPGCYVVAVHTPNAKFALPAPLCAEVLPADRTVRLSLGGLLQGGCRSAAFRSRDLQPVGFQPIGFQPVGSPPSASHEADPEFALVPAGPALIGDVLGIGQEDERPARLEYVPAFWIGRREVTNRDYAQFLNQLGRAPDPAWASFESRKCRLQRGADGIWHSDAPDLPMVTVSLAGAKAYCQWRTEVGGALHRLPSEVEWEKAARGPGSFVYAYGNVYQRARANQESGTLQPVGQYPATGFGTWDLTGNAFEWTQDGYPSAVPGTFQVLRGGSFVLDGMYLRNSFRMRQRPDTRTDDFGFRLVREVLPPTDPP